MSETHALKIAIELFHLPSQIRTARTRPLPNGTHLVLRLIVDDPDAIREAQSLNDRPLSDMRQAAIFFVEQILLDPEADAFRTLGVERTATTAECRANMALLLKWLHPDLNGDDRRATMARQVIDSWKLISIQRHADQNLPASIRLTTNIPLTAAGERPASLAKRPPSLANEHRSKIRRLLRVITLAAKNKLIRYRNCKPS